MNMNMKMNMKGPADYPLSLFRLHYSKNPATRRIMENIHTRDRVKKQFLAIIAQNAHYPGRCSDEFLAVAEATLDIIRILEIQSN